MKALDLIGAVGATDLRRRVGLIGADEGIARYMLDRLRGDQVAAIVKALLDDAETARKFTIRIPGNLVAGHGLPQHVLTNERSVNLRHTVWDTPALLLANTEDDQETSLQNVTPLGAKLLTAGTDAPVLWVAAAGSGLPLAPEQLAVWRCALSGLNAAEDWSLQQMATYVAMTRQRIAEESQPLLDSLGWAMPALMLPRDSGYFRTTGRASFRFHSSMLPRLPPRLRVLVGCAEVLQGGAVACDFVDLDLEKPRVAMVSCDDIDSAVPFVTERVKVDLGRLKVYSEQHELGAVPIYFKSRFLPADFSERDRQIAYESTLMATGLFKADAPEPKWTTVLAALGAMNASH